MVTTAARATKTTPPLRTNGSVLTPPTLATPALEQVSGATRARQMSIEQPLTFLTLLGVVVAGMGEVCVERLGER